jgi:hypothetical protein
MTDDLAAYLQARLAEIEQVARVAAPVGCSIPHDPAAGGGSERGLAVLM